MKGEATRLPDAGTAQAGDWLRELRAPFLVASVMPVLVGAALAWTALGGLDWSLLVLTLAGVILLHLGANITNDYWDFMGGTDLVNRNRTPFSGGSPLLVEGRLRPRAVLRAGKALLVAGSAVGLAVVVLMGDGWWVVLLLGVVGLAGAYFYSAPPISLASKGVGELVIGSCFGVLVVLGTYFVQTREVTPGVVAASVPVSLWIAAVIWVNQMPDAEADGTTGKRTLVVRLGPWRSVAVYSVLQGAAVGFLLGAVALSLLPWTAALALAAVVPAAVAIVVLGRSHGAFPHMEPAMAWTAVAHVTGSALLTAGVLV